MHDLKTFEEMVNKLENAAPRAAIQANNIKADKLKSEILDAEWQTGEQCERAQNLVYRLHLLCLRTEDARKDAAAE